VLNLALAALFLQAPGRPLYYWGARPATLVTSTEGTEGTEARVTEVHGVVDGGELVLKVTFDRPVQDVLYLPSGAPVSGRLRATLYVDGDADRQTGWAAGPGDARAGADYRVDLGVLALGADPAEGIAAQSLVTVSAVALTEQGRQRIAWRGDHDATPDRVSLRGDAVEMRLPADAVDVSLTARLVMIDEDEVYEGRLRP
jgi:hypothetical protein